MAIKLVLRLTSLLAYLQACMIPKNHDVSVFFIASDAKYLGIVFCMVATFSELCLLLPKTHSSKLATIAEEGSRNGTWRAYFAVKRAKLFNRGYAMLDGSMDDFKISTDLLYMLEWPALLSVGPLQSNFDLVMSIYPGVEVLKGVGPEVVEAHFEPRNG